MSTTTATKMFVEQSPYSFPSSTFEDFFNMDFASGPGSSSSSPSPRTPPSSFGTLPLPDPRLDISEPSSFFNLYLDEEFSKIPPPTVATPYDFLGAFNSLGASGSSSSSSSASPEALLAIDPQLVGTPATSKAMSDFGEDDEEHDEEENTVILPTIKVGGKGRSRKGTVLSGGIVKRTAKDKENTDKASPSSLDDKDIDMRSDDWRPSPEEYKKMSSKEKRQLRNKISARNFRVRRKEYISTLEGDIAERDKLLDAVRTELGSTQSENAALRQEIAALKKALLAGRGSSPASVLPPPAPLSSQTPTAPVTATSSPLLKPNTQKDLPSSPRVNARGFWAGGFSGMSGGITPVHTTLVPDLVLGKKPLAALQENINPSLNANLNKRVPTPGIGGGFDSFTDSNPFTFKHLDAYRMQLWERVGAQQHAYRDLHQHQQQQQQQLTGLASGLRPHYFATAKKQTAQPSTSKIPVPTKEQAEHAVYAALASQTLVQRLGSAFWDAFSGGSSGPARGAMDADKVRRVLEGKAVVRVVDVEPITPSPPRATLTPRVSVPALPKLAERRERGKENGCGSCVTDLLEESMRSLSLAKK